MNLNAQKRATANKGHAILTKALDERRELTDDEADALAQVNRDLIELNAKIEKAEKSAELMKGLDSLGSGNRQGGRLKFDARRALAKSYGENGDVATLTYAHAQKVGTTNGGVKALIPTGQVVTPTGLIQDGPIPLGRPLTTLLDAVTAVLVDVPPTYAYFRQTLRTNNAAAVADGDTKPTSLYGLERVEDHLRVIAHLSEPVNKFWLTDVQALRQFIESELGYGLNTAVENMLVNGDGEGENPTGILNTSGIQVQAYSGDGLETVRKAITALQNVGAGETVLAVNPTDWEALNLLRTSAGDYLAASAVQSVAGGTATVPTAAAALQSWGVPVALSTVLPAGTGVMFDTGAVKLMSDSGVTVEWDSSTRFASNELLARCEGRFGVVVESPMKVVEVDLAA